MLLTRVREGINRAAKSLQNASERTRTARREAIALVTLCAGALTVLSLLSFRANDRSLNHVHGIYDGSTHNWVGPMGALWADLCLQVLGLLSWGLAASLLYIGARTLVGRAPKPTRRQLVTAAIFAVSVGTLIELLMLGRRMHYPLGGVFGAILARFLREHFAPVGAAVIAMTGAILAFPFGVAGMLSNLAKRFGLLAQRESEVLWQEAEKRLGARGLLPASRRRRLAAPEHVSAARALPEADPHGLSDVPLADAKPHVAMAAHASDEPAIAPEGFAAPPSWLLTPKADVSLVEERAAETSSLAPPAQDAAPTYEGQDAASWPSSVAMAEELAREAQGAVAAEEAAEPSAWDDAEQQVQANVEANASDALLHDAAAAAQSSEPANLASPSEEQLIVEERLDEDEDEAGNAANMHMQAPNVETVSAEAEPVPFIVHDEASRHAEFVDPVDAYAAAVSASAEASPAEDDMSELEEQEAVLAGGPNLASSAAEALAASDAQEDTTQSTTELHADDSETAQDASSPELVYEQDELQAQASAPHDDYVFEGSVSTDMERQATQANDNQDEFLQAQSVQYDDDAIDEEDLLLAEDVEERDFDNEDEGDETGDVHLSGQVAGVAPAQDEEPARPYEKPPTSLLHFEATAHLPIAQSELEANAERLESTLRTYGIDGHVREIRPGPVVTMYEYVPGPGIKLARIASLADDLAMSMEALRVRIVAPIPGKGAVGIEIPNESRDTVHLKEIVESESFASASAPLSCALGKDIEGSPVTKNLAHMPHLLVAGATGAGKSVSVNAMIMSLLFKATPEEVRMIMVDPKMLELSVYEGIPHLLLPVVTDPKKASLALRWAVEEMERRYELLSEVGVRSIDNFNQKIRAARHRGEKITVAAQDADMPRKTCEPLPYILVIVDELADLMMVASREVETSIMRLAQMARAAGIHLILATQRPSVDVITGVIKANFPSRIAFQVASRHDSRTIIDANGAEQLLGRGDMLLMSHSAGGLQRIHGAFVGEDDIERTVAFVKAQGQPKYDDSILLPRSDEMAQGEDEDFDEMYDQAVAVVAETQQASVSMIQRRMRIGYNRAARMVERMEREGVVGPGDGAKPREVLVSSPS